MRALDGGQSPETLRAGHRNGHAAPREGLQNSDNEENGWMNDLKKLIREVPDYPKPGILFYDLTTLLKDKRGFHTLIDRLCEHYDGHTIDVVAGRRTGGVIFVPAPASPPGAGVLAAAPPEKHPPPTGSTSYPPP